LYCFYYFFFFSSRRRHTRFKCDWSSDVCSSDLFEELGDFQARLLNETSWLARVAKQYLAAVTHPHRIHVLPGRLTALLRATWERSEERRVGKEGRCRVATRTCKEKGKMPTQDRA